MKSFITAFLFLAIITLSAQEGFAPRVYELSKAQIPNSKLQISKLKFQSPDKAPGDTIFYEDFDSVRWGATSSNGDAVPENAPDGWAIIDFADNDRFWRWSNIGPRGAFTSPTSECGPMGILESSTADNGFIMMEADWYLTNDDCEFVNSYEKMDNAIQYSSIDFSDNISVFMRFEHMNRFCCSYDYTSNAFFKISIDNGASWIKYDVSPEDLNVASDNPTITELDLSNVVGGCSNVVFQFHMEHLSHYHWEIDDVLFFEPYECDLRLNDFWNDYMVQTSPSGGDVDPTNDFYGGFYSQPWFIMQPYVGFRGAVENFGTETMSNVKYNVDVYRNGSLMVTHTSNPVDIQPGEKDTLEVDFGNTPDGEYYEVLNDTAWSTYIKGDFEIVMYPGSDNQDQNPSNDTIKETFKIVDSEVSYCNTDPEKIRGEMEANVIYDWIQSGLGFQFELPDPSIYDTVHQAPYYEFSSVNVYIPAQRDAAHTLIDTGGVSLAAIVYKYDDEDEDWVGVFGSDSYTLTLNDTCSWLTLPIGGFTPRIYEKTSIRVMVIMDGTYFEGHKRTIQIGADIDRKSPYKYASILWVDGDWLYATQCPAITLNMNYIEEYPYTGTNQLNIKALNFKIYPNPNTGTFTIEVEEESTATISNAIGTIMDVFEVKEQQTVTVDYQPGVYFVQLKSKNRQVVHRLIIE